MNLRMGLLAGILVGSLLVGGLPNAAAQGSTVCGTADVTCQTVLRLESSTVPPAIKPLSAFIGIPIQMTYEYERTAPVALSATKVELRVTSAPSWAVITISPQTVFMSVSQLDSPGSTGTASQTQQIFLLVSATSDAPAFQQGTIQISATADPNGALEGTTTSYSIPINADFFSIIEATTETTIQKAKPQAQVIYPVTVTNFGNALTKVEFVVDQVPQQWQVTPPSPVTLESRQQGGQQNSRTANFVIQTPFWNGYLNVVGAITVRLNSWYALDPQVVGDRTIVSTLTTTKGFYVPGFEPLFAAIAVGGLAIAMNRRERPGA